VPALGRVLVAGLLLGALVLGGCEDIYPEVVVVNRTGEKILLRNASFSGCLWQQVLAFGESSSPGRCLPGEDRVHFQKLDVGSYCQQQAEDGTIDGVCACSQGQCLPADSDPDLVNERPLWFNYQTVTSYRVGYGEFHLVEITCEDWEQDFSVPGPYGH